MKRQKTFIRTAVMAIAVAAVAFSVQSCESNSYKVFSNKYRVQFSADLSLPPFNQAADTPGRFITVRRFAGKLTVTDPDGNSTDVELTRQQDMVFQMGLAGLILGKPALDNDRMEMFAYDLGCPECDVELYRLSVSIDGFATCEHCHNKWTLTDGFCVTGESRPLYRYRTYVSGQQLTVSN